MKIFIRILPLAFLLMFSTESFSIPFYAAEKKGQKPLSVTGKNGQYTVPSFRSIKGEGGLLFGIRLMPTVTSLDYNANNNGTVTASTRLGFGIGGLIGININDNVGLQLEAIYSSLAQQYKSADYVANVKLNYINFPLMLTLNTGYSNPVNLNLSVGPQLGLNIGSNLDVKEGGDSISAELAVKKSDFGFAYGAGLDFGLTGMKLSVGFRGVLGLVNINDNSRTLQTNQFYILDRSHVKTYSIYVGLTFGGE